MQFGVLRGALVVELHVVPVDLGADGLVDVEVRAARVDGLAREPRRDRGVRDDVLARGELSAKSRGEGLQPRDRAAIVEGGEVLVVDINAIYVVLLDPCSHRVGDLGRVSARAGRSLGRTESGDEQADACGLVSGLDAGTGGCVEGCPFLCLINGTRCKEERHDEGVVTLEERGTLESPHWKESIENHDQTSVGNEAT